MIDLKGGENNSLAGDSDSSEQEFDEILEEVGIQKRKQFFKDMNKFLTWLK